MGRHQLDVHVRTERARRHRRHVPFRNQRFVRLPLIVGRTPRPVRRPKGKHKPIRD